MARGGGHVVGAEHVVIGGGHDIGPMRLDVADVRAPGAGGLVDESGSPRRSARGFAVFFADVGGFVGVVGTSSPRPCRRRQSRRWQNRPRGCHPDNPLISGIRYRASAFRHRTRRGLSPKARRRGPRHRSRIRPGARRSSLSGDRPRRAMPSASAFMWVLPISQQPMPSLRR